MPDNKLSEDIGYIKASVKGIEAHLAMLNGQVQKNSTFRVQAKVWMTIAAFVVAIIGGAVSTVLTKLIT